MAEIIEKKCIISGDIIEFYEYEKGYGKGLESKNPDGRRSQASQEDKELNRGKVLSRAKKTVRRLINANIGQYGNEFTTKFLTLTFADNITDLKIANYEFKKFIKRMNYEIFQTKKGALRYVAVPEIQKKRLKKYGYAVWHYHVVLFNIPYVKVKKLEKIWSNGGVHINKINHIDNVGAYVTKYMTKDNKDLMNEKCYFTSRNLFKPTEITDKKRVENLANSLPVSLKVYESKINNDYLGDISYTQYNIRRQENE